MFYTFLILNVQFEALGLVYVCRWATSFLKNQKIKQNRSSKIKTSEEEVRFCRLSIFVYAQGALLWSPDVRCLSFIVDNILKQLLLLNHYANVLMLSFYIWMSRGFIENHRKSLSFYCNWTFIKLVSTFVFFCEFCLFSCFVFFGWVAAVCCVSLYIFIFQS